MTDGERCDFGHLGCKDQLHFRPKADTPLPLWCLPSLKEGEGE